MTISREPIYAALFALVSEAAEFTTADRRLRHWSDVSPAEQPALFVAQRKQNAAVKTLGAPAEWTLFADIYVYAHSSDPYLSPATILNPLVDAIDAALAPVGLGPGGRAVQTLGMPGLVQHAYITGSVDTDEGVLGDQAVAIIPVEILCVG
ncbi:MAG TPA: hypothetical protein VHW66_18995 [Stellaceae bacterium]|jgi:hypothetical protein|nr:hypothetical protein [Stellaceae bacterium]